MRRYLSVQQTGTGVCGQAQARTGFRNRRTCLADAAGGIDEGEDPEHAARRELYEETNVRSVRLLDELDGWLKYDLPPGTKRTGWRRHYRGQEQKWFAFLFEGQETEIDVVHPGGGRHKAEFLKWKWVRLGDIPRLVVPFKRPVYEEVVTAFARLPIARDRPG